jgi:hypothetical protein
VCGIICRFSPAICSVICIYLLHANIIHCGNLWWLLEPYFTRDFLAMARTRYKEYLPITGLADFNKLSAKLIFGPDR